MTSFAAMLICASISASYSFSEISSTSCILITSSTSSSTIAATSSTASTISSPKVKLPSAIVGSSVFGSSVGVSATASVGAFIKLLVSLLASSESNVITIFSSTGASAFFGVCFWNGSLCSKPVAIRVIPIFSPRVAS